MSPTKLCEWGSHGLCSGLSVVGPCPCGCHQELEGQESSDG